MALSRSRQLLAATCAAVGALASSALLQAAYTTEVLADNPLAYYRLGEASGSTTAADSAPVLAGDNAGAVGGGAVTFGTTGLLATDPTNTAVKFGGANSGRLEVAGFDKVNTGYSVEFLIRIDTLPGGCCAPLVSDGTAGGTFFLMNYLLGPNQGSTGDLRPHFGPTNSPVATDSDQSLVVGRTYHIVTTWTSLTGTNNASIYIDGVLDKQVSTTTNIVNDAEALFLGRDNREGYNGAEFTLDEVAVYDYALTGARVAVHAAAVPEPGTVSALLLGGAGLLARRRRMAM